MAAISEVIGIFPGSIAQEQLWSICSLSPNLNAAYNLTVMYELDGVLDAGRLNRCVQELARRHEPLRTRFQCPGSRLEQVVLDRVEVPFVVQPVDSVSAARDRARVLAGEAFDLNAGHLWRVALCDAGGRGVLILVFHHLVVDGWSVEILVRELRELYLHGAAADLDGAVQYADFSVWQRERLSGEVGARLAEFWRGTLEGMPELALPLDRTRPARMSGRGGVVRFVIGKEVAGRVAALGRAERATPFAVLLAAFHVLLSRICGQWDTPIGAPVANRVVPELEGVVGLFVNSVVLRVRSDPAMTFRELVGRCRDVVTDALEHQELPFSWVVNRLAPARDPGRNPLFQVMFSVDDTGVDGAAPVGERPVSWGTGLRVAGLPIAIDAAKFDLNFALRPQGDGTVHGALVYSTDLFEESTARAYADALIAMVAELTSGPDVPVSEVELRRDRATVLPPQPGDLVHRLVWEQAARASRAPAVVTGERVLTYAELVAGAEELAAGLRSMGVAAGDVVAVCLPRSAEFIRTALAVLHLGAAYLPLNHLDPAAKETAVAVGCRAFVTEDGVTPLADSPVPLAGNESGDRLAYVINTSGTTGTPKAVGVGHTALLRYLRWVRTLVRGEQHETLWMSAPFVDLSVPAYLLPLLSAGTVHIVPDGESTLPASTKILARRRFDFVRMTPTHVELVHRLVTGRGERLDVGCFFVGGEFLTHEHVRMLRELSPGARVLNQYGPTETIIGCSILVIDADTELADLADPLPVGPPAEGVCMYVLDTALQEVPDHLPGEMYVGGDRLSLGYLRDPRRTAATFVPDPRRPGRRMYKTGDRARRLPGGLFAILGRYDRIVKIGGNTVDLDALENRITRIAGVRAATAAVTRETGGAALMVTAVPAGDDVDEDAVRAAAREVLPATVRAIIQVAATQTAVSGKKSRAVAEIGTIAPAAGGEVIPFDAVGQVWRDVLGLGQVPPDLGFFDAGGNSLLLTILWGRLRERFPSARIDLIDLFEYPTVREQASLVERRESRGANTQ